METVGALPAPDVILPTTIIHRFGIASENGTEEKQCHFCFGAIEAEELLAMDHRVVTKVLTVSVLDIGQHRPWWTRQYAMAIAGHYFRTINYVFCVWKKRTTTNSLW